MRQLKKEIVISTNHKDNTGGFSKLKQNLLSLNSPLSQVTSAFKKLESEHKKSMGHISAQMTKMNKQSFKPSSFFPTNMKNLGGLIGASSIIGAIGGALTLSTAAEFEAEFLKMKTVVKETGKSFDELKALAEELGAKTQFTGTDALKSIKLLGASGWDSTKSYAALQPIMELTGASQVNSSIDLSEVTDKFSNFMNGFGLDSSLSKSVGNQLAYGFTNSNQTFAQLMDAVQTFAPLAKSIGISHEEAIAHAMVLADKGIKDTIAGTAMAGFVARMPKLPPEAQKIITSKFTEKEYSGFYNKDSGKIKDLAKIFELFDQKKLKTGEVATIMGQEAGKYLVSLISKEATEQIRKHTRHLRDTKSLSGLTTRLNDVNMQGFLGSWELLTSALEGLSIKIANLGILDVATFFVKQLTSVVDIFSSLPSIILKPLAFGFVALGAFFTGKLVTQVTRKLLSFANIGSFSPALSGASSGFLGLGKKKLLPALFDAGPFMGLAKPLNILALLFRKVKLLFLPLTGWGALITGIVAALSYTVWFVIQNWSKLTKALPWLEKLKVKFLEMLSTIGDIINYIVEKIGSLLSGIGGLLKSGVLRLLGDPENKAGFDFNFLRGFESLEGPKENTYNRFDTMKVEYPNKENIVKVQITADKLPPGLKVKTEKNNGPSFDLPLGMMFEFSS